MESTTLIGESRLRCRIFRRNTLRKFHDWGMAKYNLSFSRKFHARYRNRSLPEIPRFFCCKVQVSIYCVGCLEPRFEILKSRFLATEIEILVWKVTFLSRNNSGNAFFLTWEVHSLIRKKWHKKIPRSYPPPKTRRTFLRINAAPINKSRLVFFMDSAGNKYRTIHGKNKRVICFL